MYYFEEWWDVNSIRSLIFVFLYNLNAINTREKYTKQRIRQASGRWRKKSQTSRDFLGQIRGKNGRFRGNFAGIFEAEKRLVKNGQFCENFPSKFRWKAIGFALI